MVLNEAKRGPKPPDSRTSKGVRSSGSRNHALGLAPLFGIRPDQARRSHHRDRDRGRNQDQDQDHDRNHVKDRARARDSDRDSRSQPHHRPRPRTRPHQKQHRQPLVEVELRCLDERYFNFKFAVKPKYQVRKLESYIRRQYDEKNRPIAKAAHFTYYAEGRELQLDDEITSSLSTIWYRMSRSAGELEEWKFTHFQDETNGRLESSLTDDLARAIDEGATCGELRRKVAEAMHIPDANRIVLIARGGIRPGLLQGNSWEVRQIKNWLCRWISIDVDPEGGYVILKGLGREYVYHPTPSYFKEGMRVKAIKSYMEARLFRAVSRHGKSKFDNTWSQISLTHDGKFLGREMYVRWGATYVFDLHIDAAETFSNEETWLLRPTETCSVCMEDKKITELPVRITEGCKHPPTICKDCLKQWLASGLETGTFDRLKCPDCPEILKYDDVQRYATKETFSRYDTLMTRAALKDIPNFYWCMSTTCESGQIYRGVCPEFKCAACKARHCVKHNVSWHEGETCEEYDRRHKQRKKDEKASEEMVKKTSKKCPECKKDVHKFTGCNHITCVCGHEWCYICLAKYERNHVQFLFCRHNPGCTERDPFIDLIDGPNAIGPNGPRNHLRGPGARHPGMMPLPLNFGVRPPPPQMPPHLRRLQQQQQQQPQQGEQPRRPVVPGMRVHHIVVPPIRPPAFGPLFGDGRNHDGPPAPHELPVPELVFPPRPQRQQRPTAWTPAAFGRNGNLDREDQAGWMEAMRDLNLNL
ncbi:hypothetical protein B0T19DRAFT_9775 [Cercophora scortea]|uniref:RBR-type E3 ubiquitin transferase n=1 Tax=Cercophora scortea TaxID=314031 RepID=A0AAE0J201_9PEZI|nr:hypothetical protein B0T19DRAFT_9775 [Cercophora scortea]